MDTWHAIERFGLPLVMLGLLALFITKTLWPFLVKRIEAAEAIAMKQLDVTQQHLGLAQQQGQAMVKDFTEALKRRDDSFAELNKVITTGFGRIEARFQGRIEIQSEK